MKPKLTCERQRAQANATAAGGGRPRAAACRGIALIITLIMLSVITFMAITFLVLSHRERGAVTTTTDQTVARFTAQTALDRAKAELMARIIAATNSQNFDLMVSTNFINRAGFDPAARDYRTNVNYDYAAAIGHPPLSPAEIQQNMANLLLDPRPPVFVTNRAFVNSMDFRFYLDLNRNRRDDPSGLLPVISPDPALPYYNANTGNLMANPVDGLTLSNTFVGDPEWIGVLEYPDRPHSANNRFLARYAYLVVPASKTLDVNYIHNDAKRIDVAMGAGSDGFVRNQGVGTWEINLAAFLTDLNTNYWDPGSAPYNYATNLAGIPNMTTANTGPAFDDALSLLRYRYFGNFGNLKQANALFGPPAPALPASPFLNDLIDEYSDGPFMTGSKLDSDNDVITRSWPGSDNPNHFFTPQEFFDPNKVTSGGAPIGFVNRLSAAGTNFSSYDRYTFYRMLAQLSTASEPRPDRINLNYVNVDAAGHVVPGMETNMIRWAPLQFFYAASQRMFEQLNLRDLNNNLVCITNIPIYVPITVMTNNPDTGQTYPVTNIVNYYTPAVHRVVQLAANMFEATTNSPYPCIYRPFFQWSNPSGTNPIIRISGYELVNGPDSRPTPGQYLTIPFDLNTPAGRNHIRPGPNPTFMNAYGFPWVIGARKGFPNLNEVVLQSVAQITRKIQLSRRTLDTTPRDFEVRQMLKIGVSNVVGVEVWNSYRTNYARRAFIQADGDMTVVLTNDVGLPTLTTNVLLGGYNFGTNMGAIDLMPNAWQGTDWRPDHQAPANPDSFLVPMLTNIIFLPDSAFLQNPRELYTLRPGESENWSRIDPYYFPQPQWGLTITNHIRCMIVDGGVGGRVVDYVQLDGLNTKRDLEREIRTPDFATGINGLWSTNYANYLFWGQMPQGDINQLDISFGNITTSDTDWRDHMMSVPGSRGGAIAKFRAFVYGGVLHQSTYVDPLTGITYTATNTDLEAQAPFTPTSKTHQLLDWNVNDPLVHYTTGDLSDLAMSNTVYLVTPPNSSFPSATSNFWRFTHRYDPWGGNPVKGTNGDPAALDVGLKDPMLQSSDGWDFPTNLLPNVGWLGRVHRGTPWQSIYLKAPATNDLRTWVNWSGDSRLLPTPGGVNLLDAAFNAPTNDWRLFNLFTTAINDNAARGRLSVNQTNLAAWSAVLSGVIVLTNSAAGTNPIAHTIIEPAGIYNSFLPPAQLPPLVRIWRGINETRSHFPNRTFNQVADVLATPQLTVQSPFLDVSQLNTLSAGGINDEVMERIPQQILSLLTLDPSPRFVIYSYGQTLKPADHSILTSGPFLGMCTNYQVTAETATRAIMRVDPPVPIVTTNAGPPITYTTNFVRPVVTEQFNVLPPD